MAGATRIMVSTRISIKQLYGPALAEGEGLGTAYEYFTKRLLLAAWLRGRPTPRRILQAGLPEKYGLGLDVAWLAAELKAALVVVDDRPERLARAEQALIDLSAGDFPAGGIPAGPRPFYIPVTDLTALDALDGRFDLVLSSEVLQRLSPAGRYAYVLRLRQLAGAIALFVPNAANPSHTSISGLAGLSRSTMQALAGPAARTGFIDLPPFPPGITRSTAQRARAGSGRLEALIMAGLGQYARLEQLVPGPLRRRQAHIVYGLIENGDR